MGMEIRRRIQFCAGHRVFGHESKCANLHGHEYTLFVEAKPKTTLDGIGRVIDFSVLKERLGTWIDHRWDHGMVLNCNDPCVKVVGGLQPREGVRQKLYLLPYNPTAENMASYLLYEVCPVVFRDCDILCTAIELHETPNCSARVEATYVPLSQHQFALIDAADKERLGTNWHAQAMNGDQWYAYQGIGKSKRSMAEAVFGPKPANTVIGHWNGNTLDNRRDNLLCCSQQQNLAKQRQLRTSESGYCGVTFDRGKYQASIGFEGKQLRIGRFRTAIEAAEAYDKKAYELNGQFTKLNFPERLSLPSSVTEVTK